MFSSQHFYCAKLSNGHALPHFPVMSDFSVSVELLFFLPIFTCSINLPNNQACVNLKSLTI